MLDGSAEVKSVLERCERAEISPAVALMEMLIATEDEGVVGDELLDAASISSSASEILALLRNNAAGCARVASMLRSGVDSPPQGGSIEEGVAFCRRLFDWSVRQSEESSVALYSLCNPSLLAAATREIVDVLRAWKVLAPTRRALDIGCGIGRMEEALAGELASILAIDVSSEMVEVARRRCASLSNVAVSSCSGLDLRDVASASVDVVFAVDSFPYIVQSGAALARMHFFEVARVLRARGDFIILNFSYRDDPTADRDDVATFAAAAGFHVEVSGTAPFSLWNGTAFWMQKRAVSASWP
jgi:ubiquinone/menaquinone biosynthesis C-methylase UbiE